jgi:hypothetical protein
MYTDTILHIPAVRSSIQRIVANSLGYRGPFQATTGDAFLGTGWNRETVVSESFLGTGLYRGTGCNKLANLKGIRPIATLHIAVPITLIYNHNCILIEPTAGSNVTAIQITKNKQRIQRCHFANIE